MDYQVSARKYRPGTFDDVIGQPHVVQTLVNAVSSKRIAQAYLFSGTRGVGKTTVARILAKALNCEQGPTGTPCTTCVNCTEITQGHSVDVIEIDGASNTSVDDVREIRENVKFAPFHGTYRVYIIDEVHMLSNSAFNALLKTLEEPPPHVVFIFATTEIHKIPATILSRCQHYNFRRIAKTEIIERLRHVAEQDGITLEDRSLAALARASEGSMRDGLSLLDQAVAFGGKSIVHTDLEALLGAIPQEMVRSMIRAITSQDSAGALRTLSQLVEGGHELRAYCADVVEYVRHLLVVSVTPRQEWPALIEVSSDDLAQLAADKASLTPEQIQQIFTLFLEAEDALRFSAHPRFVLETAAIKATRLLAPQTTTHEQPGRVVSASSVPHQSAARSEKGSGTHVGGGTAHPARAPQPAVTGTSSSTSPGSGVPAAPSMTRTVRTPATTQPMRQVGQPSSATPARPPQAIMLNWEQFQEEVGHSFPNIAPFLEMGRLVGIEGNVVTIGFAKQATVARGMLEKADNIQALASLCERIGGQPVRLRVIELTEADPPGPTMAQIRAAKEQEQKVVLFEQAKAHPVVKQALEMFGAELQDVRTIANRQEVQE
ncbi:MAG TPA: DNA polymerase III subunit gamma/tau [Nitrospira sp.]|nr:DNA polymerase III subunit gamma/tau [Nitrospira sp.]